MWVPPEGLLSHLQKGSRNLLLHNLLFRDYDCMALAKHLLADERSHSFGHHGLTYLQREAQTTLYCEAGTWGAMGRNACPQTVSC